MKKTLTSIFVVAVNYYMLSFLIGVVASLFTALFGPLSIGVIFSIVIIPLLIVIGYQLNRSKFDFYSFGECVVGNISKSDILEQNKQFSITRIPIFLLLLIILILNENIFDGLGNGIAYSLGDFIKTGIILLTIYYGSKNFFLKPDYLPITIFAGGLLFTGTALRKTDTIILSAKTLYWSLSVLWLIFSLFYKAKSKVQEVSV